MASQILKSTAERNFLHPSAEVMKHYYNILKGEIKTFEEELENLPDFKPGKTGI